MLGAKSSDHWDTDCLASDHSDFTFNIETLPGALVSRIVDRHSTRSIESVAVALQGALSARIAQERPSFTDTARSVRIDVVVRPLRALERVRLEPAQPGMRQVVTVRIVGHDPRRVA